MNFNPPNVPEIPASLARWFDAVGRYCNQQTNHGTTAKRPTTGLRIGLNYFDTSLGYAIWYDGTNWVNSSGVTV